MDAFCGNSPSYVLSSGHVTTVYRRQNREVQRGIDFRNRFQSFEWQGEEAQGPLLWHVTMNHDGGGHFTQAEGSWEG